MSDKETAPAGVDPGATASWYMPEGDISIRDTEANAVRSASMTGSVQNVHYHPKWVGQCDERCHRVEPDEGWATTGESATIREGGSGATEVDWSRAGADPFHGG